MPGSTSESWVLAIDFGTTASVVAVRVGDRAPQVIEVGDQRRFPSTVVAPESGELLLGRVAEDLAPSVPERSVRGIKSHLGEPHPVVIGGRAYDVGDLVAAILRRLTEAATAEMGSPPAEVRLTYPATWNGPRRERLRAAAARAGIASPVLIPEPVAAAVSYAEATGASADAVLAVYDLGGGTFDTTVLRAQGSRWFEVLGRPTGDGQLGGELFDELLLDVLTNQFDDDVRDRLSVGEDPAWRQAAARLRVESRRARELLSDYPYADLVVATPVGFRQARVTREELEQVLTPYVAETVEIVRRAVSDADVDASQLHAICLSGGASRTPLVERMLTEAFPGVRVDRRGDPKAAIATGAALAVSSGTLTSPGMSFPGGGGHPADVLPEPPPSYRPPTPTLTDGSTAGGSPALVPPLIAASPFAPPAQAPAEPPAQVPAAAQAQVPPPAEVGTPGPAPGWPPAFQTPPFQSPAAPQAPGWYPPGQPPGQPPVSAGSKRRWALPAAIAGAAVLVAGITTGAVLASGGSGKSSLVVGTSVPRSTTTVGHRRPHKKIVDLPTTTPTTPPLTAAAPTTPAPITTVPATTVPPTTVPPTTVPPTTLAPATTLPPATTTPTTPASGTTLPSVSAPPLVVATQAQVDDGVLLPSDLPPSDGTLTPVGVELCGNYPRPTVYKSVGYKIMGSGGESVGTLYDLAAGYPTPAAAQAAAAAIPATVPSCLGEDAAEPFTLSAATGVKPQCDQSYLGYANALSIDGNEDDLWVGISRCGATLAVFEWLLPAIPSFEQGTPSAPVAIQQIQLAVTDRVVSALS